MPLGLPDGYTLDASEGPALPSGYTLDQPAKRSAVADFFVSMPRAVLSSMADRGSALAQATQIEMGQPVDVPSGPETTSILEKNITGELPKPQGMAGRFGGALATALTDPTAYVGPGSAALKLGGAALSGLGGQAGEETGIPGAQFAGSLAGGIAAAKTLGPRQATAAIPTAPELKAAAKAGYKDAAESGLQIAPSGLHQVAENAKQELLREGFDPDSKVFKLIGDAQRIPSRSDEFVSSQTFDIFNKRLARISRETQMGGSGPEPTADAAAAATALRHFREYGQNIPERDVLAGSAQAYKDALGTANQNYGAYKRVQGLDTRINKSENAADRQVAGSIANQIRQKVGGMLDKPAALRGLTDAEKAQLDLINNGGVVGSVLRQAGRGGAPHVIPIMGQMAAAHASGGASLPLWAGMVGARLADNALTKARAQTLADMLAKRSPLYQSRESALPTTNTQPNQAQLLRSLLLSLR